VKSEATIQGAGGEARVIMPSESEVCQKIIFSHHPYLYVVLSCTGLQKTQLRLCIAWAIVSILLFCTFSD
jgi:hypothetical protein